MSVACRFVVAFVLSWLVACDPEEGDEALDDLLPTPSKSDPARDAAEAAATTAAESKKGAADQFATCMAGCFEGTAQRSPGDRHTCRLTCGAERIGEEMGASADGKTALGRFDACLDADCRKPGLTTDAATCRLTCAQAALAGPGAPALAKTARGCAASCLEHTGNCEAACSGSPDDLATCRLQCTSLGERCVGKCEKDPSARPELGAATSDGKAPSAGETKAAAPVAVPKKTLEKLPAPP